MRLCSLYQLDELLITQINALFVVLAVNVNLDGDDVNVVLGDELWRQIGVGIGDDFDHSWLPFLSS
jgi:hypothetical protein